MNIKHFWESCSVNFPKVSVSKLKTFTKPGWCRLTKYQLMLRDLVATCGPRHSGRVELQVKKLQNTSHIKGPFPL